MTKPGTRLYVISALLLIVTIMLGFFAMSENSQKDVRGLAALQEIKATEQYLQSNAPDYDAYKEGVESAAKSRGYKIEEDGSIVPDKSPPSYLVFALLAVFFVAFLITALAAVVKNRKHQDQQETIVEDISPSERQEEIRGKNKKSFSDIVIVAILLIIVAGGISGWYYFYGPCGMVKVRNSAEKIQSIMQIWLDAENIASRTSRIALAGPVAELQDIRLETSNLDVPPCLDTAQENLVKAMQYSIEGYLAFMSQDSDTLVNSKYSNAARYMRRVTNSLKYVQSCTPFCP